MGIVNIKMIGPEIKARAGEKVTLRAVFDRPCWSCIHERRNMYGYMRINDQKGGSEHVFDALVHEDTTHFIFSIGDPDDNDGRPDLAMENDIGQLWCPVTLVGDDPIPEPEPEPTPTPEPEPEPEPEKELGKYKYSVGVIPDQHICKANNKDKDNWKDESDFKAVMDIFASDKNLLFVSSCGDISEAWTNDNIKHPEATAETDYDEFREIYDVSYWQVAGLRFFSPLGNHDFMGIFESRYGDEITGKKNSETIIGYNAGVYKRLGNWVTGQQVNCIPANGRNRIVFDLEKGKTKAEGQSDMNFFANLAYVDLYAKQAGYTGKSIWDANKGGISDEAIRLTKAYVNSHWEECKHNLSGWAGGNFHGRNAYSKMSFYLKKDSELFAYLSVDYGDDKYSKTKIVKDADGTEKLRVVTEGWHDNMVHARQIIDINSDDPYIRRMVEFVADTGYSEKDRPYDYQYYSPNLLIWYLELVENNQDRMIFPFIHHYLPNKVGNGVGLPKDGAWQYADIHPAGELTASGINIGSNCLTGIEFYFLNKINNMYKNCLYCFGHSHMSHAIEQKFKIDNHDYPIVPAGQPFGYTKASLTPIGTSAWNLALPSLSKPKDIVNNEPVSLYDDAEMTILDIHENGVVVKGYKVIKDGKNVYDKDKPILEKTIYLK